jgi:hypothetical protein
MVVWELLLYEFTTKITQIGSAKSRSVSDGFIFEDANPDAETPIYR